MNHPDLFDSVGPPPGHVDEILARMDKTNREYLDGARAVLYVEAQDIGPVTADDFWRLIEEGAIPEPPEDMHHNALGGLFSQSDLFRATGSVVRSQRDGANGNYIHEWEPA